MGIFGTILAVLKAIPILDSWFQQLMVAYTQARIASMKRENLEAIRTAFQNHDQRPLEGASGNPHPGEVSNAPGSEIVSNPPPGVNS